MKKLLLIALLFSQLVSAQEAATSNRHNEVRVDVIGLVTTKLNLTYERFLNKDFSVGVSGSYSDSKKVNDDFEEGYRNNMPRYEVVPFVRYNLSKSQVRYYFAEVFVSANGGDYREVVRMDDGTNGYYTIGESDYFDIAAGGGLGYKMYLKEKFAIEFMVGFGSNLIDKDKSPDVVARVGLSFGYRF